MNLKSILLLTSCLLTAVILPAYAQENATDVRKQIRDIKLSEQYLYADAMSSASFDEARLLAVEELRITVAGLLAEQQKSKTEIKETLGQMEQICKTLQYNNMNHFKVFAYIATTSLLPQDTTQTETPVTEPAVAAKPLIVQPAIMADTIAVTPTADTSEPTSLPSEPVSPSDGIANQPTYTADEPAESDFAMNDSLTESLATETIDVSIPITYKTDSVAPAKSTEPTTTPIADFTDSDTLQTDTDLPLPDLHQRVLNDLLALDTYESVMLYLEAMKDDGRLMYGRISTLVSPQEAYLIIVKNGKLLTILDRGTGERTNLKTQKPDSICNYKGHAVIWLKVFK